MPFRVGLFDIGLHTIEDYPDHVGFRGSGASHVALFSVTALAWMQCVEHV